MAEGVDYSSARPDPVKLYAAGKRFVVRYGGPGGSWKHLTQPEADALTAAGLALVANAEGTADGLANGWATGVAWASSADAAFRGLGMPASKPIYLSVDFDCGTGTWPAVANALKGAASVLGPARVGVYGSYDVMQWAKRDNVARWFWQTYAWSGGRWAAHNHLEQYNNDETVAGTPNIDLCRSKTADYGQWGVDDMTPAEMLNAKIYNPITDTNVEFYKFIQSINSGVATLRSELAALAGKDFVNEPAIVAGVLAGLSPEDIAAAIPPTIARQVVDLLVADLAD